MSIETLPATSTVRRGFAPHASNICPACGAVNAPDSVFCANDECGKALGEFRYVREELDSVVRWHETLADKVSGFIGRPHFIVIHVFWFIVWVAANTGLLAFLRSFDSYPFGLLGILLSVETIFITGFLLISQNRQNERADKRAELDYEVNVRTYREIREMHAALQSLREQVEELDRGK